MRWLNRFRAHQLEKALPWIEKRRELAKLTGRAQDEARHAAALREVCLKIACLRGATEVSR